MIRFNSFKYDSRYFMCIRVIFQLQFYVYIIITTEQSLYWKLQERYMFYAVSFSSRYYIIYIIQILYNTIYHPISNRNQLLSCILLIFRAECDNISGSKDGTCADGFGVCCIGKYMFLPFHITNHLRILRFTGQSNKLKYCLY